MNYDICPKKKKNIYLEILIQNKYDKFKISENI